MSNDQILTDQKESGVKSSSRGLGLEILSEVRKNRDRIEEILHLLNCESDSQQAQLPFACEASQEFENHFELWRSSPQSMTQYIAENGLKNARFREFVRSKCKHMGIDLHFRNGMLTRSKKERIGLGKSMYEMYKGGTTRREIGENFGYSRDSVDKFMEEYVSHNELEEEKERVGVELLMRNRKEKK